MSFSDSLIFICCKNRSSYYTIRIFIMTSHRHTFSVQFYFLYHHYASITQVVKWRCFGSQFGLLEVLFCSQSCTEKYFKAPPQVKVCDVCSLCQRFLFYSLQCHWFQFLVESRAIEGNQQNVIECNSHFSEAIIL